MVEGVLLEKNSNMRVMKGETVLLPYSGSFEFGPLDNQASVLITEDFT